jgi:two-component system chemotaxis sensor kinase CheA
MDRNKLIERLMATFLGELEEHVRTLNAVLLTLEKDPDGPGRADAYKTLLRVAHSLKGAARSVGIAPIEEACHRVEEVLSAARDGRRALDADRFALLFTAADAIEEAGMRLREQQDLADSPLTRLLPRLESEAASPVPGAQVRGPASALSPVPPPPSIPRPTAAIAPEPVAPPPAIAPASVAPPPAPPPPPVAEEPRPGPGLARATGQAIGPSTAATPAAPAQPRPTPATPSQGPPPPPEPERPTPGSAFVRIPAEKLDDMLTCSGELLVARRAVELRTGELEAIRDEVARWRAEWHGTEKALHTFLPRAGAADAGGVALATPGAGGPQALPRHAAEALAEVGDHISRIERDLDRFMTAMSAGERQLERAAGRLDDEVRRVRMLPFAEACQGLERSARDVARSEGKQVELAIEGGDVELDRSVLEGLRDPLNHLVRNAVDHGIELPEVRRAAGKAEGGRVTVAAALRGTQVEVVVTDDGKGLDLDAVRAEARARGLGEASDAATLTDLVFLPGFSTAKVVTSISGRGVGLDVVKSRLESLQGTVELASEPGVGTRFTLAVPLTLTTLRALLIEAGGQTFALASTSVPKLVRVDPADLRTIEGRAMLLSVGPPLPVVELARVLGLPTREPSTAPGAPRRPALIVASGDRRVAFLVDELLTEQEIIVKSLGDRIRRVRNVAGATILPTGRIAPVLNAAHLVRSALGQGTASAFSSTASRDGASGVDRDGNGPGGPLAPPRRRLLVVDDSVTTRTLEKSILEAAGYEVLTAVDGEAGWRLLQEQGADLVVSDIEMPRLDGFALTETIRRSPRFAELPVVLLSSLASERDRSRGIEVGADAYIVKGAFDQDDLIKTIAQLL